CQQGSTVAPLLSAEDKTAPLELEQPEQLSAARVILPIFQRGDFDYVHRLQARSSLEDLPQPRGQPSQVAINDRDVATGAIQPGYERDEVLVSGHQDEFPNAVVQVVHRPDGKEYVCLLFGVADGLPVDKALAHGSFYGAVEPHSGHMRAAQLAAA